MTPRPARARKPRAKDQRSWRVAVEGSLALVGYALFTCAITWPLPAQLHSRILGRVASDAGGTIGWLWRLGQEEGYDVFGATEHTLTGAPFGWEQGNALHVQWLIPYYPAYLGEKVVGEIASYNLVLLSGFALSGVAMYGLTRALGCSRLVAAWAGMAYIVFPWHLERAITGHASLTHLELFPLLAFALIRATAQPTWGSAGLICAATFLTWLTSGLFGVMALVATFSFLTAVAIFSRSSSRDLRLAAVRILIAALWATVAVVLLSVPGRAPGGLGAGHSADDLSVFGVRLSELVVPAPRNIALEGPLTSFYASRTHLAGFSEISNYLGWATIILAGTWLAATGRRKRLAPHVRIATVGLAGTALAALLCALPSPLVVGDVSFQWTPSRLIFEIAPQFRVPSRFVALAMTALIPLAALGFDALRHRLARSTLRLVGPVVAACVFAVSFLELSVMPTAPAVRVDTPPALYAALSHVPDGILAEYPLVRADQRATSTYVFWQRRHERPLLNGAPGGTFPDDVRKALVDPDSPGTAEALAALGVTTIITRPDPLARGLRPGSDFAALADFRDGAALWRVVARPAPAVAALDGRDFAGPIAASDGIVRQRLRRDDGRIQLWAPSPAEIRITLGVDLAHESVLRITGQNGSLAARVVNGRVDVGVIVPRGRSSLRLELPPTTDTVSFMTPRVRETARAPTLRALPQD